MKLGIGIFRFLLFVIVYVKSSGFLKYVNDVDIWMLIFVVRQSKIVFTALTQHEFLQLKMELQVLVLMTCSTGEVWGVIYGKRMSSILDTAGPIISISFSSVEKTNLCKYQGRINQQQAWRLCKLQSYKKTDLMVFSKFSALL